MTEQQAIKAIEKSAREFLKLANPTHKIAFVECHYDEIVNAWLVTSITISKNGVAYKEGWSYNVERDSFDFLSCFGTL